MPREKRTYLDRLKAIPGIRQAFMLTMEAAMRASTKEDGERDKEKYDELRLKIATRVSELWELSPIMEQYLIQRWVEGETKINDLESEILFTGEEITELSKINSKLETFETKMIIRNQIRKGHLYLDVTGLSYKDLRNAYRAIIECRKMVGINLKEIRKGAPESMDFTRALLAARGEERGLSRKKMAKLMGFKIYRRDIPSGTYPLFQKYIKVGRWILHRMNKLEDYIHELTGIEIDTL
jgi:hypothetical protein